MSVNTMTMWTCDRCGKTDERTDPNWQPNDWAQVLEVMPPKASIVDKAQRLGHICRDCREDLRVWFSNNRCPECGP